MKTCKTYADTHRAGPGASTVLLILLVMCLAMLGALSLSVARNDLAVTRRALEAETAFYQAQSQAALALANVDEALLNVRAGDKEISAIDGFQPDTGNIILDVPVDEYRSIRITLRPLDGESSRRYEILENRIDITQ